MSVMMGVISMCHGKDVHEFRNAPVVTMILKVVLFFMHRIGVEFHGSDGDSSKASKVVP